MPPIRPNPVKAKLQRGEPATCISGLMTSEIIDFLGPIGIVRHAFRPEQAVSLSSLADLDGQQLGIDMFTTVVIGNSNTYVHNAHMITPRGYEAKPQPPTPQPPTGETPCRPYAPTRSKQNSNAANPQPASPAS